MAEKRNADFGFVAKFTVDIILGLAASVLAIWLRLGPAWTRTIFASSLMLYIIIAVAVKAVIYGYMGYSHQSWRSVGLRDAVSLGKGMIIFVIFMSGAFFFLGVQLRIPRSIPINDGALTLLLTAGARALSRFYFEDIRSRKGKKSQKRTLIVGAGEAGTLIARELLRHPETDMRPVGFLDDDPSKRRQSFLGLPVLGNIDSLTEVVQGQRIQQILIAIPSAHGSIIRKVVRHAKEAGITPQIVPGIYEVLSGEVEVSQIRNVDVEDLLRREPVRLDNESIAAYLEGKTILVTGAGGSIGSEIVNQVMKFEPQMLVLLGRGENSIFEAMHRLKLYAPKWAGRVATVIADVRNNAKLEKVFVKYNPQVIFHAAAHKHVPLMEDNPDEAIFNNIGGTSNLVELALRCGVERFVNLSTDKAVNPASIMGASKRIAEMLVQNAAKKAFPGQSFVSVRFGNVLESRGSVVPLFRQQIAQGGPITVTHPEIERYFMTIPEAVQLVLQAAAIGENGSIYVLDMGEPIKIVELARDLIRLSGFEPDEDIEIVFTGLRPGEKLHEELVGDSEKAEKTVYDKIYCIRNDDFPRDFDEKVKSLFCAAQSGDRVIIIKALRGLIGEFGV